MKLHEVEGCDGYWDGFCRVAVPGGWLYAKAQRVYRGDLGEHLLEADFSAPTTFVPDPTAEHVAHGAGGAAAAAIYRDAVRDCWAVVGHAMRERGTDPAECAHVRKLLDALRFDGSTSQTGEG